MRPPRPRPLHACLAVFAALLALPATSLGAGATISAVDCDAGGVVATLRNESGGPAKFTVLRDEVAIATAVVPAGGTPVTRIVPIAEGAAAQVTVRFGGSYVSSYARRSCEAGAGAASSRVDVAVAGAAASPAPVVPGTGTRASTDQPQASSDRSSSDVTLEDAASAWPLLLLGLAALLAAAALVVRTRLRATRRAPAARPPA